MAISKSRSSTLAPATGVRHTNFVVFVVFAAFVFLLGGGARYDIQSLVVLRPLSFIAVAYALWVARSDQLKGLPLPFYLLLLLAALMIAQLIPLPPEIWTLLPGRDEVAKNAALMGLDPSWRPLSLSPYRTWNSLLSLGVPIAAFLLMAVVEPAHRTRTLSLFLGLGMISLLLGLLQVFGGPDSPAYLYRITNDAFPVGLFANRNHQAIFLAIVVVLAMWYASSLERQAGWAFRLVLSLGIVLVLIPFSLILGSRAGLVATTMAVAIMPVFIMRARWFEVARVRGSQSKVKRRLGDRLFTPGIVTGIYIAVVLSLAAVTILLSRDAALQRFSVSQNAGPSRLDDLPLLVALIKEHFLAGAGFGSFESVFRQFEPTSHLSPNYLNQAHNDWAQLVIEGGLAAIAFLGAGLTWLVFQAVLLWKDREGLDFTVRFASLAGIVFFAGASLVDYPLRTPSMMFLLTILIFHLKPDRRLRSSHRRNRATR